MQIRHQCSPKETASMNTKELRNNFLVENIFEADQINLLYSHYDRVITGGFLPLEKTLSLPNPENLKANFFLERRELGIINVGGKGIIEVNGQRYELEKQDCIYIGKGIKDVKLKSASALNPALLFMISSPAHQAYPTQMMKIQKSTPVPLGAQETANQRTIYKYIHPEGIQSCQLVMGLTMLEKGSVWNTMPPHTHDRRMEVYFYYDIPEGQRVLHLMGEPEETRHIWMSNHEAVISPPWSIHSGCGTSNYSFIWAMAGENQSFTDMDFVETEQLR